MAASKQGIVYTYFHSTMVYAWCFTLKRLPDYTILKILDLFDWKYIKRLKVRQFAAILDPCI